MSNKIVVRRINHRLTEAAVIAGIFACWTRAIKLNLADATDIVFWEIPAPGCNGVPFLDENLHYQLQVQYGVS